MSNELEKVKDAISDFIDDIDSDDYIIIDSDTSSKISKMIFGDITKASAAKQVAVGGVSGWYDRIVAFRFDILLHFFTKHFIHSIEIHQ